MTKEKNAPAETKKNQPNIPAGYKEQSADIVGFWDSTSGDTIHMIPRTLRIFDSKIDPAKSSTLLIAELVEPIDVQDADGQTVLADKGQMIGIWTKAGMAAVKNLGGVDVFMLQEGEKDTGKPNPMFLYKVMSRTKGVKVPVSGDFRKTSLPAGQSRSAPVVEMSNNAADDIPFC